MKASFDKTYCTSEICKNKCDRHKDKWEFEENELYWFMEMCEKENVEI